jgi:hypothetical protein
MTLVKQISVPPPMQSGGNAGGTIQGGATKQPTTTSGKDTDWAKELAAKSARTSTSESK